MLKRLSTLILTYNRLYSSSEWLPKLVDNIGSIDHEILIWDNASSDGTYDWLTQYAKINDNVKVFGSEKNYGLEAINFLAEEATGDYVLKVDDDISVPKDFATRLVNAYEQVGDEKIAFLGWDMAWGEKTFATRSGKKLYKPPQGRIDYLNDKEKVLVHYTPSRWMVNGVCRLSKRDTFLKIKHPKDVLYGVDHLVSIEAEKQGYYIAYFSAPELVVHKGVNEREDYRRLKDAQLRKYGCPKHV